MKTYKLPKTWLETSKVKIKNVSQKAIIKFYLEFMYLITTKKANHWGLVHIHHETLQSKNKRYRQIIDIMIEHNLIEVYEGYSNSEQRMTKAYKLVDIDNNYVEDIKRPIFMKKIRQDMTDAYAHSVNTIKDIKVNWSEYNAIKDTLNQNALQECISYNKLVDIENSTCNWIISENVQRLFTTLTSLKKEFRNCLTLDDEKLVEIDIINCIPQMFGVFLKYFDKFQFLTQDFYNENFYIEDYKCPFGSTEHFIEDVLDGVIYENIMEHLNIHDRKEIKVAVMSVLFSRNGVQKTEIRSKVKDALREMYPEVYRLMCDLKRKEYACESENGSYHVNFSRLLFRFEVYFMFSIFGKALMHEDIQFTTIHDAFMVKKSEEQKVRSIMKKALKEAHGIQIKF